MFCNAFIVYCSAIYTFAAKFARELQTCARCKVDAMNLNKFSGIVERRNIQFAHEKRNQYMDMNDLHPAKLLCQINIKGKGENVKALATCQTHMKSAYNRNKRFNKPAASALED